jgi:glycosyltransferase involved in cell wall biosynthesis
MKKLRIAIWNNLPSGGGKRALFEMASGLVARGHALESWCPSTADRAYLPLAGIMPEHVTNYTRPRLRRWDRWLPGRLGHARFYRAMDRHCRVCAAEMTAGRFDVLLAANCQEYAVGPIGRHFPGPRVLYCGEPMRANHEVMGSAPRPPEGSWGRVAKARAGAALRDVWKAVAVEHERADAAAFDLVLANSAYSRESLLRAYGLDARVCLLGINTALFRPTGAPRGRFVVGLGSLQTHKDPGTAITALATLPPADRPELVWIGNVADGAYVERMLALAGRLGVVFTPLRLVSDEALVDRLNRAAVMLYTSRLEPFGFAPLEANACGVPVVAVAEGGVRETIRHGFNGLLVPDRDPVALGAAVAELLGNPDRARALGENGRAWVTDEWTWAACVDRLEATLHSTVARVAAGRNVP